MKKLDLRVENLRKFGVVVMGCSLPCFALLVWLLRHKDIVAPCAITAGVFAAAGLISPKLLKPVYIAWMGLASVLGWINSRIILLLLFYGVITPIGLIVKLVGKDLLGKKIDHACASYWVAREKVSGYDRQF